MRFRLLSIYHRKDYYKLLNRRLIDKTMACIFFIHKQQKKKVFVFMIKKANLILSILHLCG